MMEKRDVFLRLVLGWSLVTTGTHSLTRAQRAAQDSTPRRWSSPSIPSCQSSVLGLSHLCPHLQASAAGTWAHTKMYPAPAASPPTGDMGADTQVWQIWCFAFGTHNFCPSSSPFSPLRRAAGSRSTSPAELYKPATAQAVLPQTTETQTSMGGTQENILLGTKFWRSCRKHTENSRNKAICQNSWLSLKTASFLHILGHISIFLHEKENGS